MNTILVPNPSGKTNGNLKAWKESMDNIHNPRKGVVYAKYNGVGYEYLGLHKATGDRVWRRVKEITLSH